MEVAVALSGMRGVWTKETPLSRTNPPATEEDARARLDVLAERVAQIEVKLQHTEPEDFATDEQYRPWRQRAKAALGYAVAERRFLERWLADRGRSASGAPTLAETARAIRARASALAEEIRRDYTSRYSDHAPPEHLDAARIRAAFLGSVKQRLQAAFAEVTDAWTSHPLRREDLPGVKAPLQQLLLDVELESRVLRLYRTRHDAHVLLPSMTL